MAEQVRQQIKSGIQGNGSIVMTNSEMNDGTAMDNGTTRADLMQRVALMEEMIAEGRRSTAQYGWLFLLWGLVYFAAVGWGLFLPFAYLAWPICVTVGFVLSIGFGVRQKRTGGSGDLRAHTLRSVWTMMGIVLTLFLVTANVSHHFDGPGCFAAILFFIGLAHATSAMILRWGMQGLVAVIWCAGGVASFFFIRPSEWVVIFLVATFFGQILFGLYAMMLDRQRVAASVQRHA